MSKVKDNFYQEISINKLLIKIWNFINPIVSSETLWKILSEFEKPFKPQLPNWNPITSTDIIGSAQKLPENPAKIRSKGSLLFVEALVNLHLHTLKKHASNQDQNSLSNGLVVSRLSLNHE